MKKVAIIGGGFRGVGVLKVLKQKGYEVKLFEKNDDVGGVWHPTNNYKGLKIHTPAKLNQFFDFPFPKGLDLTKRLESPQVYAYLKSFCEHFDLYPHMKFNASIQKICYDSQKKKSTLILDDKSSEEFDYVINTNGYCDKSIPCFKNSEKFKGRIIHSFEASDELVKTLARENKKVTILGAGKTAADLVASCHQEKLDMTWLYRKPYWFFRFTPLQNCLKDAYKGISGSYLYKAYMLFGFLLANHLPWLSGWFWRQTGCIDTFGEKHDDYRKFHVALIDDEEFDLLKNCNRKFGVMSEIDRFVENGYYTKDNRFIESDVVVCCTGSSGARSQIPLEVDGQPLNLDSIHKSYRGSVIPEVPNLIFTAYHHFAMGLFDGELQGDWIDKYIQSSLTSKQLQSKAIAYKYPFFTKLVLFDSNEYFFPSFMKMQFDFINNHELGLFDYVKFEYDFFFNASELKPLTIYKV